MKSQHPARHLANSLPLVILAFVIVLVFGGEARAQRRFSEELRNAFETALVIRNARVLGTSGTEVEGGTIICRGGRITTVGKNPALPFLKQVIDASGKTVTPGLIDVRSSLGMTSGPSRADPTLHAGDAFDRFALKTLRKALGKGVTTVYLSTLGTAGIQGRGAVVRLQPREDGSIGETLAAKAALDVDLGSDQSPISRAQTFATIRKQFESARAYRRALEDYDEAVEEYEKKLKERAAKEQKHANGTRDPKDGDRSNEQQKKSLAEHLAPGKEERKPARKKSSDTTKKEPRKAEKKLEKPQRPRRNGSSIENARILHEHGVPIGIVPGSSSNAVWGVAGNDLLHLPMEAAHAVRGGLPEAVAIEAITIGAARILGVDHRVGSIEVGKDADLAITDGPILHYLTHVRWTVVNGRIAHAKMKESLFDHIRPGGDRDAPPPDDHWPRGLGEEW